MMLPIISSSDVDLVKKMTYDEREDLKGKIKSADPHIVFTAAGDSGKSDKRKIICPNCGNGTGDDGTPVEVTLKDNVWLYNCLRCNDFSGDLLKIIADSDKLNLKDFGDLCRALAIGATMIGYPLPDHTPQKSKPTIKRKEDYEELPLIKADIAEAQKHLEDLPESQRRGLSFKTYSEFKCGFLQKWQPPSTRIKSYDKKMPAPTRRIIIPAGDEHYQAVALLADRNAIPKKYHKQFAGSVQLFNLAALTSESDLILVTEGEFDCMSLWQAFGGNIAVVAVLGVTNWKQTLLPRLNTCTGKKFLILFDGTDKSNAGREGAEKIRATLLKENVPAVCRFFEDFLNYAEKISFGDKTIDANQILQDYGDDFLKTLTQKIIADVQSEFATLADEQAARADDTALTPEQKGFLFSGDLSDDDFARRITFLYGDRIRYLANPTDEWLIFNRNNLRGGVWQNVGEKNSVLFPFANELADKLIANAEDKEEKQFGRKLKETKKKNSSIAAIKGLREVMITPKDLNTHNNLLNCLNGVVDLETGKLYPADPKYLLTQQCNAEYRKGFYSPVVDKFFRDTLPDEETRAALIRFLGYAATGSCAEEKALFINGGGGNGKGTFTKTTLLLFGDYGTALRTSAVLHTGREQDAGAATTELNPLENCRLAIVEELPQGGKLDVAKFKNLTGGDKIPIRHLHREQINIEPHFSPILSGNYRPELSDTRDDGLLRRLMNIIFEQSFIGSQRDPHLKEKLALPDSLCGYLSRVVDSSVLWYRDGLLESSEMKKATQDYLNENDFIGAFISEYCDKGANLSIPRQQFLNKLKSTCAAECLRLFANRDRALVDAIKRVEGVDYARKEKGYEFIGIGWKGAPKQGTLDEDLNGEPVADNVATPD